ncbi:MAG: hypothetical protein KF900_08045 [Bacteroidetes bacterium]|nr:hypothetical protein [Bacteroidota bacterium]
MEQITVFNKKNSEKMRIMLSLFIFKEDGTHIVYSPSLDLSGYGKTETEAKKSFEIVLKETILYALNNNTLNSLLISMGWFKNIGANIVYKSANITSKLSTNDYLQNVINQHSEVKLKNNVELSFA